MGAWGLGPFDNDTACDWGYELDAATQGERPAVLHQALSAAADAIAYLNYTQAAEAVAAAAIVAAHRPGGPTLDPVYSPDCLRDGGPLDLPTDLLGLSLRALDRVVGEDSHWRELWEEADLLDEATATLASIRAALATN